MASIIDNTFESSSNRSDNLILKMLTIINQIPTTTGINVDTKLGFIKTKIPSTTDITPEMILSKKISNPPNLKSSTNKKIPLIIRNVAIIYDITSRDISGFTTRSIPITRKNTDITIDAYIISFNFFFIFFTLTSFIITFYFYSITIMNLVSPLVSLSFIVNVS